ncbi:MAG: SDR family NAD(P)-dependent oxidoreductase [Anaerolineae bacterium]|nr:SDR family NAD(P)-dependent oxidoreductase [Anaerolineae bacterium]
MSKQNNGQKSWTAADMPDQTGRVVIVTGANSGIGLETVREFARKGAQTILACRCMDRAQTALDDIKADIPDAQVEFVMLDLASLASVREFASAFRAKVDRLDVLINNAGIMNVPYGKTEDGFEMHLGVNHLGHFALTGLLIDLIVRSPGGRVVNVSSGGHRFARMNFDNLMFEGGRGYAGMLAYGQSKLANLLFTYELQRRLTAAGYDTLATAAHPGWTETNLQVYSAGLRFFNNFFAQHPPMGTLPTLYAAAAEGAAAGGYYGPSRMLEMHGYPKQVESSAASHNIDDARKLWALSEELTGVRFTIFEPEPVSG